jgi:hypothetical protein
MIDSGSGRDEPLNPMFGNWRGMGEGVGVSLCEGVRVSQCRGVVVSHGHGIRGCEHASV